MMFSATKKSGFFGLPHLTRLGIYLLLIIVIFPLVVRGLEPYLTHHPSAFDGNKNWALPSNTEETWLITADNIKLNAWFLHAPQPSKGTVLYSHGNGGNLTYVRGVAQDLVAHGLDVLIYDYRGYGRSEGSIPSETELNLDGDAAYDFLTKTRGVKIEKLAIYGLSLGTTVSTDVASRRPCGALVLEAPLSSASDMTSTMLPILPRALHWIGKNKFESERKISSVKCPVLIAHGDADEMIPTEQGRKVFAAANEPKKLMIIPHGKHWLPSVNGYLDSVSEFIVMNLAHNN
jgi:uncharacterized protein